MKHFTTQTRRVTCISLFMVLVCGALVGAPLFSTAHSRTTTDGATIVVTNDTSRSMKFLYTSPTDNDTWTPNQLDQSLSPGQSLTISVDSCSGAEIKVIAEDGDGCFVSAVVACAANSTWTITNDAVPNCGN